MFTRQCGLLGHEFFLECGQLLIIVLSFKVLFATNPPSPPKLTCTKQKYNLNAFAGPDKGAFCVLSGTETRK